MFTCEMETPVSIGKDRLSTRFPGIGTALSKQKINKYAVLQMLGIELKRHTIARHRHGPQRSGVSGIALRIHFRGHHGLLISTHSEPGREQGDRRFSPIAPWLDQMEKVVFMNAYKTPRKVRALKQRFFEALMECLWIPARLLFALWIQLTPTYHLPSQEHVKANAGHPTS